jgi:hypothetical protein
MTVDSPITDLHSGAMKICLQTGDPRFSSP